MRTVVARQLTGCKVGTFCLVTGGTFLASAGMMSVVIVFVTGMAVKAEVFGSEEAWEGITTVVMAAHFDEDDLLVLGWTLENDLIVVIHGKDHDLVMGEMTLKRGELSQFSPENQDVFLFGVRDEF